MHSTVFEDNNGALGLAKFSKRNPRIRRLMYSPKDYQEKHSSISGSYSRDGDCDYWKARDGEKSNKYYLYFSLGFLVRVRLRY